MSTYQANSHHNRRDFLKLSALSGAAVAMSHLGTATPASSAESKPSSNAAALRPIDLVRVGFVGVGGMGTSHVMNLLQREGVEIRAVCDIIEGNVARIQDMVVKAGKPKPEGYSRGDTDFRRLCDRNDLDIVYTATPWEWHTPVCLAAMNSGKHAATEVPAAVTLDECWSLVEASEKTGKYCVILENCCYERTELMILNMVRQGLLGELLHAECGYLHDCRGLMVGGSWRAAHGIKHNGDLYPTHGLGPVAQCMNINRGNRFTRLVSMGSQSRGLNLYAKEKFGPDHPEAQRHYAVSDVVSTLIQTALGQTITVNFSLSSPRPYSREILVQGTKGIVRKYPEEKIYLPGRTKGDNWETVESYRKDYEHPLWKEMGEQGKGIGHGSMDVILCYRLIQALRKGIAPDIDVYDAAAWSAVTELSAKSIAGKSEVDFPDFTRGKWETRKSDYGV